MKIRSRFFILSLVLTGLSLSASAQDVIKANKVELDDIQIKGELLSDNRINFMAREKNSLADQIPLRTSYREDILEDLPPFYSTPPVPAESSSTTPVRLPSSP